MFLCYNLLMVQKVQTVRKSPYFLFFLISLIVLAASFVLSLCLGAEKLNFFKTFASLFVGEHDYKTAILFNLRLPRSLLVLVTGILLGGSGAIFQLFFRNPLAEPGILGISSGATLGAVIATFFGLYGIGAAGATLEAGTGGAIATSAAGNFFLFKIISPINLFAFGGALLSGVIVTLLALTNYGRNSSVMLLICGTALGTLYSSLSSLILLSGKKELHTIYTWILGSFNGRGWNELIFILIPTVAAILIMFLICTPLDLLNGGEQTALSLGLDVTALRVKVLICGALAVSASVCAGGTINFVGLIAPHIARKFIGSKGKTLLPASMIFGAILLLLSDTGARLIIAPAEVPAGVITSILGVPFFIALCVKRK